MGLCGDNWGVICLLSLPALGDELRSIARRRVAAREMHVARLARLAGLSQPYVQLWFTGRRELSMEAFDAVRVALGVGLCELMHCDDCIHVRACRQGPRRGGTAAAPPVLVRLAA